MNDDRALTDDQPDTPPVGHTHDQPPTALEQAQSDEPFHEFSIEELLEHGRRPERIGRICLRADLQADHEQDQAELAGLIDADGELLEETGERSLEESSNAARAEVLIERINRRQAEMRDSMRHIRFQGMSSEDWPVFVKKNSPRKGESDESANARFEVAVVAEAAAQPKISVEQALKMKQTLSHAQWQHLVGTALGVNRHGGIDVPKSLRSLLGRAGG